jgi:glyoxylase-like metal-dependent hydrolase (beta-lactamase superfamily II)
MKEQLKVEHYDTSTGVRIFRLPVEVFTQYYAYAHLVVHDGAMTLIDVGSGFGNSFDDLKAGFATVSSDYGISAELANLKSIIITHGHIDHFGGLMKVKEAAPDALVAIHELDRPVLINYDERVVVSSKGLRDFFQRGGVPDDRCSRLMDMYMMGKRAFKSVPVDKTLHDGDLFDDLFKIIHVPGHTPGLVMVQIADILITSDHILPGTSVALAPESLMPYCGTGHYLESLAKAQKVEGVRVALGGHEWAMDSYYDVARKTFESTQEKVEKVLSACGEPRTIYELAVIMYGELDGYSELLKLEQTGARIEYLNQRGLVMINNLDDLERDDSPVLRYKRV